MRTARLSVFTISPVPASHCATTRQRQAIVLKERAGSGLFQRQPRPLSFRSQLYRRGICFRPAAKQQIPRATMSHFGMTILWRCFKRKFQNCTTPQKENGRGRPFSIVCSLRALAKSQELIARSCFQLISNCSWCSAGSLFTITVFLVISSISISGLPLLALSALATSGFTRSITSACSRCFAILRISR
jgi:hypothetical protein